MVKEKYKLEDFDDFIFSKDGTIRDMGWIMAINSIDLKNMPINDLIELDIIMREIYRHWDNLGNRFLQKINKAIQRHRLSRVAYENKRYYISRDENFLKYKKERRLKTKY